MATPTVRPDPGQAANAADWQTLTLAERDRLRSQAREQALALRQQAIDEFWRGTDAWLSGVVTRGRRSADRLAARLRQHAKQRARGSRVVGA